MSKTIVIISGGYHPYHAGHYALYKSAQRAFPDAKVYVAATNDTSTRPFPFPVKEKLAKLAGVEAGHFVQVKSPFRAEEITAKFDPSKDVLIFVRSEKDATKPPQPGGVKKDGNASYLQPLLGAKRLEPFSKHAYMAYLPTVEFGPGMTSATEIRTAWPQLNDRRKTALVMSLYPRTQGNAKLAANVVGLLDAAIGSGQGMAEGVEQSLPPMKAELVEVMPPWDFEVAVYNPLTAQKEHYIIRPVDMWEMQMNRLQIMTADVRDLQNGNSFFAELESAPNKHYERVFDAISALFWNDRNLNKKLQEIIKHSRDKQTMHKPLPGVTRSQNVEIPADEYIKGAQAEKDLMARLQQGGKKGMAEGSLQELANTSLKVKEPKDLVNTNDRKQVTYKVMKFKSGKDTYLINFTMKGPPAYGKKQNYNVLNVAFGVKEKQDDYSFGDEINTDLTAQNKNQFLIYSTVINAIRKFITEYNTEVDEIVMQGAGQRQEAMYQRFFRSAGKYFPGWHHDGKHSLVRDVPRQQAKKVKEQGVAEGSEDDIEDTRQFRNAIALAKSQKAIRQAKDGKNAKYYADGTKVTPDEVARRAAERKAKKQGVEENQGWAATLETVAANHTTANTSGAGAGMTATYQRRDNQPIGEDYLDERRL